MRTEQCTVKPALKGTSMKQIIVFNGSLIFP